jgi:hypothetical protein
MILGKPSRDWNAYYLGIDTKSRVTEQTKKTADEAKHHRDTHPSRELAAYAGTYDNPGYGEVVVSVNGDHLALKYGRLTLQLTHYHFDTFTAVNDEEEIDEPVTFALDSDGEVKKLTLFGEEYSKKD